MAYFTFLELERILESFHCTAIDTNWHRICTKDITILGSWAFTANDIPLGIQMIHRVGERYPWHLMQT